jgi:cobalamin synthase
MSKVFATVWKTLLIWPAFCGLLIAILSIYDAIQNGRLGKTMADPDWLLMPIFAYLMFWIPALVTAMAYCLIGIWRNSLPIWSVPISALLAFLVFYYYEYSTRPYFKSGITKDNLFLVAGIIVSAACCYFVWHIVRKHWNQRSPA